MVKIYRFEDSKTGEVFEGTRDEYAFELGLTRAAVDSRIHTGRAITTAIGKKENGEGNVRKVFTETETDRQFYGYYKDAVKYFNIPYVRLKKYITDGLIVVESPAKATRKPKDNWDIVSDKHTKRKRRLECLLKSFAV